MKSLFSYAAACGLALSATAAPVTLTAEMFLEERDGPVVAAAPWIEAGSTISFTYTFESTTPDSDPTTDQGLFVDAISSFSASDGSNALGPFAASASSIGQSAGVYEVSVDSPNALLGFAVQVNILGGFDRDELVTTPEAFGPIGQSSLELIILSGNQETVFNGEVLSIVPEPSSALLLALPTLLLRRR